MTRLFPAPIRRGLAPLCLLVFLVGSNNCLLGAMSGARMDCLVLPGSAAPKCPHCAPAKHLPARSAGRSCCPDPAIAPASLLLEPPAATVTPDLALHETVADHASALTPWYGHGPPVALNERPPASHSRAPLPARAPPLA